MVHEATSVWLAVPLLVGALTVGVYVVTVLDRLLGAAVSGDTPDVGAALRHPVREVALAWSRPGSTTERPDAVLWHLAPAFYGALAAVALAVIPFGRELAVADVRTGIVLFGAAEMLLMVSVFLHGWSSNSHLSLLGGYRYVALALSFMLLEMFVLIAVALPAESLSVGEIVEAQRGRPWNVVTQPLALPLFLVVALGAAFWGPLDVVDGRDLAGGSAAETSGPQRLAWQLARRAALLSWSAMTAAVLLGGYLGPWLPGWTWLALKTVAVLAVLLLAGHLLGRVRLERFVLRAWTVLLPLSFANLAIAGVEALAWAG